MSKSVNLRYHHDGQSYDISVYTGMKLSDLAQDADLPISFGCSQGACGSCKIKICAGSPNAVDRDEEKFLRTLGAGNNERLACKVVMQGPLEISIDAE